MNKLLLLSLIFITLLAPVLAIDDVPGWSSLINGSIGEAAYIGYNTPLNGYLLVCSFVVVSAILFLNTGVEVSFIVGIIFFGMVSSLPLFMGTEPWLNSVSFNIILIILGAELASVFYKMITKT